MTIMALTGEDVAALSSLRLRVLEATRPGDPRKSRDGEVSLSMVLPEIGDSRIVYWRVEIWSSFALPDRQSVFESHYPLGAIQLADEAVTSYLATFFRPVADA